MSVTADIFFKTGKDISDDVLRHVGWLIGNIAGDMVSYKDDESPCITLLNTCAKRHDGMAIGRVYEVNIAADYYGIGYERGQILKFIAIAECLEMHIPNCSVFHGNDINDNVMLFDGAKRDELRKRFLKVGHSPYCLMPGAPLCPRCKVDMGVIGMNSADVIYGCVGCNYKTGAVGGKVIGSWTHDGDIFKAMEAAIKERWG